VTHGLGFGPQAIFLSHLFADTIFMVAAIFALNRHFSLRGIWRRLRAFEFDPHMMRFAIPQGISMTFHFYMSHIDVLMLTGLGVSKVQVACYGTASRIIRELRQIRLIFSSALAPIFARQRAVGHIKDIEDTLGQLSRWTTTLCIHAILPLIVLRKDLLMAIDPAYGAFPFFVLILLVVPYVNCAFGLAGNALVFSGRSGLSLANNVGAALLGTALNWLLIPRYGLLGAALSSAASTLLVTALQIVEIRSLEKIHWQWRAVALPHLGMIVCVTLLFTIGDPATFGAFPTRVALALASVGAFSLMMLALGHPEYRALVRAVIKRLF
jgi:O-antigen/teichoic acid export membrane protein